MRPGSGRENGSYRGWPAGCILGPWSPPVRTSAPPSNSSTSRATPCSSGPSTTTCSSASGPSSIRTSGPAALHGRNDFEGYSTNRVYALLAKAPSIAALVEHPAVVEILDALLLPGYLLSANLAINLLPGETAQTLHTDDGFYRVPRPRAAIGVSAIWAIDDFTAENGATQIIPGSHRWGAEQPAEDDPTIMPVEMPAGSVVVFQGTLWHRGGANTTDRARLAITPQYCEPWARQQEQMVLSVGAAAAGFSDRVRSMLGLRHLPAVHGPRQRDAPAAAARPRLRPGGQRGRRRGDGVLRVQAGSARRRLVTGPPPAFSAGRRGRRTMSSPGMFSVASSPRR